MTEPVEDMLGQRVSESELGLSLAVNTIRFGQTFQKGLLSKTVDDQAVILSKLSDPSRVESSGQIKLLETRQVQEVKDEAQVPRVPGIIQPLHLTYRLFCQFPGLTMNRGTSPPALPDGIKLAAAKRANIVNQAGIIFLEEGATCDFLVFFLQPVLPDLLRDRAPEAFGKPFYWLADDDPFEGSGVHITHVSAAKRTPDLAYGVFLELGRILLEALIYPLQRFFFLTERHGKDNPKNNITKARNERKHEKRIIN